ncbi:MAG TPA: glycoside hydrolase family 2 TIM barrel-domain containing protein [Labilithrix sp.]|nr:glycoside hydrolase family 2 TIM barrel-domain containing protein [Labilithrix sp.]
MLRREGWTSLNGRWEFALDPDGTLCRPDEVTFDDEIEVPFSPETTRSGIGDTGLYKSCWYRRSFDVPELGKDERLILHFGAVDYDARVWVDGALAMKHEGGYTPFSADITDLVRGKATRQIVVNAEDDPSDLAKPRGKQDWQLVPHSIWYPRTTGIWQTVWMERVHRAHVTHLRWTPSLAAWEIELHAHVRSQPHERLWLAVRLHVDDVLLAEDRYAVVQGEVRRRISLSDPGIDDFRNELLWSPSKPTLIDVEIDLLDANGNVVDELSSYTALRSFTCDGGRFILNGRPYPLRMVLDQGYWAGTGLTPPDDAALQRDVELTKAMGFNGARKHQKIEDPRYLYWADRLGLLVWGEMPSAYRFTRQSVHRLTQQWMEAIHRDMSHPCIVAWVPFNESWGVPNLPDNKPERHYIEALYHLTKTLDPERPVVGNDGWESLATDILGIHDYDSSPERLAKRYATHDLLPKILKHERPGGRALVVGGRTLSELPVVLSEFGGIAVSPQATGYGSDAGSATWGYAATTDTSELGRHYSRLLESVRGLELLAGFCYTQFADTYQEANGLLYADRTPKFPLADIRAATMGKTLGAEMPPSSLAEIALTERGGAP